MFWASGPKTSKDTPASGVASRRGGSTASALASSLSASPAPSQIRGWFLGMERFMA